MNLIKAINHFIGIGIGKLLLAWNWFNKRTIEDILIRVFQFVIVVLIIGIVALVGVNAWLLEDEARAEKLQKHLYDVAFSRATVGPAAPTGVRPNYGAPSTPKTRVFADTSVKSEVINKQNEKKREGLK